MRYFYQHLQHHYRHPNYLFLMISLLVLIIVPPISTTFAGNIVLIELIYGLVILMCIIYTTSSNRELVGFLILGLLAFITFILQSDLFWLRILNGGATLSFFTLVFLKIVNYIMHSKEVDANDLFACVSGYLILGVLATPLFLLIEESFPNAFTLPENADFYDFIYFSYVTLTSIGYGDISPVHPLAKSCTIMIGLIGQLYLTILVALIIGKYLAAETNQIDNNNNDEPKSL